MTPICEATVLIVDDNREMAENLSEIVEDEGLGVVLAENGLEALARLTERPVDLVITDMRMPGMDGMALLEAVHQRWPRLPVIAMTAYSEAQLIEEAYTAGVLGVLAKPIDIEQMLGLVTRVTAPGTPVLLVEDDRDLRVALGEALLDVAQAVPHMAPDAATARHLAGALTLKLAIIDVRLPDDDGIALGRELKARNPQLEVIYITGHVSAIGALKAVEQVPGVHALEKPFAPDRLLELIRSLL